MTRRRERSGDGAAATLAEETVRVRVALDARIAAEADPARKVRLYGLGEAIELFSRTGAVADELTGRARETGGEMPQMVRKVDDYAAAHRDMMPALLAAVDADLPADAPEYAEVARRIKDLEARARDMMAALLGHAERIGVPMPDPDEAEPGPKPH